MEFLQFFISGAVKLFVAFLNFIVELLHYGAIPGTILAVVLIFRNDIQNCLRKVKKVKGKEFEFSFEEVQAEIAKTGRAKIFEVNKENYDYKDFQNLLYVLGLTHIYTITQYAMDDSHEEIDSALTIVRKIYKKLKQEGYSGRDFESYNKFFARYEVPPLT